MPSPRPATRSHGQTGAITIMVALMLLVLLTIAAVSMSRNSFREIVSSGFSRQGAMADSVAESGLDWAVYWLDPGNTPSAANPSAVNLIALKQSLKMDDTLEGLPKTITDTSGGTNYVFSPGSTTPTADLSWTGPSSVTEGYTIGLTRMGKLPVTGMSQGAGAGAFTPAAGTVNTQAPDLWAVRADAQVVQGNVTFYHGKEAWITTPVAQ